MLLHSYRPHTRFSWYAVVWLHQAVRQDPKAGPVFFNRVTGLVQYEKPIAGALRSVRE